MAEKHEYLTDFNMKTKHDMAKTMAVYSGFTEGDNHLVVLQYFSTTQDIIL